MRLFISVVSHYDHDIIINLGALKQFAGHDSIEVICCDNKPIRKLKQYCEKYGIHYRANPELNGFSFNNNANFCYAKTQLGLTDKDYFIMLNPDVFLKAKQINKLVNRLANSDIELGVANLFLDREEIVHDDNIRLYPRLGHFITTYLFDDRSTMVNRKKGLDATQEYWGSCSFMVVQASVYQYLQGLDERFYMYCEDVDFCYRAKQQGITLTYLEDIHAVHFRRRNSKQLFSKYFVWHVSSVVRYSLFKREHLPCKSLLSALDD